MRRAKLIPMVVAALYTTNSTPALAHSTDDFEKTLLEREAYVEITDRVAPTFALKDAEGQPVSLADYREKVVVLWFIYTFCPDVCPLQSDEISAIQEQINDTPMRDIVKFVSITTDPVRDTPDILRAYGDQHGLDRENWTILTSGPAQPAATRAIAEDYGLQFTYIDDEYQAHGVVTHLIDKNGVLRARYHGLNFNPTNLIVHINALTNETYHEHETSTPWQRLLHDAKGMIGLD